MFTIDERTGLMTTNHKDDYCLGVVGDDESRQIIFKTKRYTETGWDKLSGSIRVNVINANGANIPFAIPSKQIKTEGDDLIITWVIYSSVCERAGSCTVSVCSTLITEDEDSGNGGKKWGAVDCDKFYVSEHTDGDGVVQADAIADATAAAIAAINSAGGGNYATKTEVSQLKEDLSELETKVDNLPSAGGGISTAFISALQELFSAVAVWDDTKISNPSAKISALSTFAGSGSDTPSEPTYNPVSVAWTGTTATINNLKNLTVAYAGTVATVGV